MPHFELLTGAIGGGSISIQSQGSPISSNASTINFQGDGVSASGSTTVTVTVPGFKADLLANRPSASNPATLNKIYYATDIPALYYSDGTTWTNIPLGAAYTAGVGLTLTGNQFSLTVPVTIANGGTGQVTQQAAIDALTGTQSSGKYLRSDGTHATLTTIQAADVPTLNQNTTGTSSNVTGVVAIANGGTNASTAPNALTNLGALPLAGGTMTGTLVLNADGTTGLQAVTYQQLISFVNSQDAKDPVAYASTSALPANTYNNGASGVGATLTANSNGFLIIDGVTTATGFTGLRALVAGEAASANNGIYTITSPGSLIAPYVLTRATDFDQPSEIDSGDLIPVNAPSGLTVGSANNGKVFLTLAPQTVVIGTSALTFSSVGNTYSAGTGLTLSGTTFSITAPVSIALGGTNATTATAAITNLSPQTTKGDLITFSTLPIRKTVGTDGQLLVADSTASDGVSWKTSSSTVVAKTANYTMTATDGTVKCDSSGGAFTIALPTASGITGKVYRIKKTDSSALGVTVDPNSTETIDGALTVIITTQNVDLEIQSDGTNWIIV